MVSLNNSPMIEGIKPAAIFTTARTKVAAIAFPQFSFNNEYASDFNSE